jgi:hypothetical protein
MEGLKMKTISTPTGATSLSDMPGDSECKGIGTVYSELIQKMLNAKSSQFDMRSVPRRPYPMAVRIIPFRSDCLFSEQVRPIWVRSNDISSGGFSFFLKNPRDFDLLVFETSERKKQEYYLAEVIHCAKVASPPGGPVSDWLDRKHFFRFEVMSFLIGCRFIRKLERTEKLVKQLRHEIDTGYMEVDAGFMLPPHRQ